MVTYPSVFNGKWDTIPFSEYFEFLPTNTYSREQLCDNGEIGNIHYGDVLIKYGCVLTENDYIPRLKDASKVIARHNLSPNDVIIADTAEDETVGKAVQIGDIVMPLVSGLHTMACRPNFQTALGFWGYYINSKGYHDQVMPYVTGIKVSSISKKSICKTELHIPTDIKEQQAIASVLFDIDEHIDNLTELIEKKKDIHDGALEDLVSGNKRLDGFDGEWVKESLGDISKIQDGTHGTFQRTKEGHYLLSAKNVFNNKLIITENESKVSDYDFKQITSNGFPQIGDVLMSCVGTIGRCCICDKHGYAFQRSVAFIRCYSANNCFILYVLQSLYVQTQLQSVMNASAQGGVYLGALKKISIDVPVDIKEQEAIASVLTAMHEEIEALEAEKEKLLAIKEGAMDDLLTGRVRLKA